VKAHLSYNSVLRQIPKLVIGGVNIFYLKCNNSYITNCLNQVLSPLLRQSGLQVIHFYCQTRPKKLISKYYTGITTCNAFLNTFKKDFSPLCCFRDIGSETLLHFFCNCKYSEDFWKQVSVMFFDTFYKIIIIDEAMIIFLDCNTDMNMEGEPRR